MRSMTIKAFALAGVSAAALAAAAPAKAEVVLLGSEPQDWIFSVDGFVNAFVFSRNADKLPISEGAGTRATTTFGIGSSAGGGTHVSNGLMPESFGFNVKSPDLDGTKVAARVSIQPTMNGSGHTWDQEGMADNLLREAYMTISGNWGEVQAGKSLGLFGSQAILNDMYLFGIGAGRSSGNGASPGLTTLGGIGYGYMYAGWNGNIRYTTPAMGGFKGTIALFEPNSVGMYDTGGAIGSTATASTTNIPRFEGGLTWAGKLSEDVKLSAWTNGTWQRAQFAGAAANLNLAGTGYTGNYQQGTVDIYGGELGGKLVYGGWDFVAHGYVGKGFGLSGLQLSFDSLDETGKPFTGYGYYVQGGYAFGQGTAIHARYGSTYVDETDYQAKLRSNRTAIAMNSKDMAGLMVSHDINKYIKVVGEADYLTNNWTDNASQHETVVGAGVVVTY
jgi:hypothetical protein